MLLVHKNISDSQEQAQKLLTGFFGDYLNENNNDEYNNDKPQTYIVLCSSGVKSDWHQEFFADQYCASSHAVDLYLQDRDTYFCVNPVKSLSRKTSAIQDILRLHVDADFNDAKGLNKLLSLRPTAVISSGTKHRYHGYWNFHAPLKRKAHGKDVTQMNKQLTRRLGIKVEAFDLSHTLRVPGTANFKNRYDPQPVEIIEWNPERKYTLEQCADLLEVKLGSQDNYEEPLVITPNEAVEGGRGKYLNSEERIYVNRLLREGLFERSSRNESTMLLTRYFYELGYSDESIRQRVTEFFEQKNNELSEEWNQSPDRVRAKITYTVKNWYRKARPVSKMKITVGSERLSRSDEAFIQRQQLKERDKLFLRDAMIWILNNKRGDHLILSTRQLMAFTNCNSKNYKSKRDILYRLGIIALALEHERKTRLANEYKVIYQFDQPIKASCRGRKRASEINVTDEIDKMILAGRTNQEIRKGIPRITRQRIHNRRRRMDEGATRSRELLEL